MKHLGSHISFFLIVISISLVSLLIGVVIGATINRELVVQNSIQLIPVDTRTTIDPLRDITFEEDQLLNDAVELLDISVWQTYSNNSLDVSFSYPSNWDVSDLETIDDIWFGGTVKIDNLDNHFCISGNSLEQVPQGPGNYFCSCSEWIDSVDEFCEDGCIKTNNDSAYDYRQVYHGEGGASALFYTNMSVKYPSICAELTLDEIWNEFISLSPLDDVGDYIQISSKTPEVMKLINDFETFVNSFSVSE